MARGSVRRRSVCRGRRPTTRSRRPTASSHRENHPDANLRVTRRRKAVQGDPGRLRPALELGEAQAVTTPSARNGASVPGRVPAGRLRPTRTSISDLLGGSSAASSAAARGRQRHASPSAVPTSKSRVQLSFGDASPARQVPRRDRRATATPVTERAPSPERHPSPVRVCGGSGTVSRLARLSLRSRSRARGAAAPASSSRRRAIPATAVGPRARARGAMPSDPRRCEGRHPRRLKGKGEPAAKRRARPATSSSSSRRPVAALRARATPTSSLEVPLTYPEAALGATVEIRLPRARQPEGAGRNRERQAAPRQGPRRAEAGRAEARATCSRGSR